MGNESARISRAAGTIRALRHRNFRLFFAGQLISVIGTWMQMIAQSWLVYRITGSTVLLGLVGFASQIPVFILAPLGGMVADHRNRHRILVATQTLSMVLAFGLAGLTLGGMIRVWEIFALAVLLGLVNAFDIPARQAFVFDMVGKDDLMNAIALNSSMVNGARIVGPAVAGILVAAVGEGWCFLINAVSYVAVIAGLVAMTPIPFRRPVSTNSPLQNIVEGFRFSIRARPIRALLILLGAISFLGMPYAVLMPVFADKILHGGAKALGVLMGASGVGALLGSLSLASKSGVRGLGRWVGLSATGFGLSLVAFSLSRSYWLSIVLLMPVGFTMMVEMAASNTLIQAMVPDELRGRVMALYSMMFIGMAPFGSLVAGALADRIGAPGAVASGGLVCIVAGIAFGFRLPLLRGEARELIVAHTLAGGEPAEEITTVRGSTSSAAAESGSGRR
ncbi:MAG: MFS transporter [Thermoanaerobaculia bacterium]